MAPPNITVDELRRLLPHIRDLEEIGRGGQKLVFGCTIDGHAGRRFVIKFTHVGPASSVSDDSQEAVPVDEARARREVDIMESCNSPTLVRLGPIGLSNLTHQGQRIVYFTEERVDGRTIQQILDSDGPLPPQQCARLGSDVATAIAALWELTTVHRDVKPANIMRKECDGSFILLDIGVALDLADDSISAPGQPVGTYVFFSPEQIEVSRKRELDFRSDLFSLGVVMYCAATNRHPFWTRNGMTVEQVFRNIQTLDPELPSSIRPGFPRELEEIILRLLTKRAHSRYRSIGLLQEALQRVMVNGGLA